MLNISVCFCISDEHYFEIIQKLEKLRPLVILNTNIFRSKF